MNPHVDQYLLDGCGRCELYKTPACKVHTWQDPLVELRRIILETGLKEEVKWSSPCYTYRKKNILMLSTLKSYALIGFFKGSLLSDPEKLLKSPGKHSQSDRRLVYTDTATVRAQEDIIRAYIHEAIELEKAGATVAPKKEMEPRPQELIDILAQNEDLKAAFEALTPGRQRGYILYFSGARQSKTRIARIEKFIPKILEGKGFHDR